MDKPDNLDDNELCFIITVMNYINYYCTDETVSAAH